MCFLCGGDNWHSLEQFQVSMLLKHQIAKAACLRNHVDSHTPYNLIG